MTMDSSERYARQIALPEIGPEGQRKLAAASVLVLGLGGLGCPVCLYLAGAGVGRIGLADADTVSLSNLQRQTLYSEEQTGRPKTECAAARLRALRSDLVLDLYPEGLTAGNADGLVRGYDIVMDCTDNWTTRFLIDDACAAAHKPWVFGSIGQWQGMASLMGGPVAATRLGTLFPERADLEALGPSRGGVIGPLPGIIGSIQACTAIQLIAGGHAPLDGRLLILDAQTFQTDLIQIPE